MPTLPFADRAFDLVLSANFLMIYAPIQDGGMYDGQDFDLAFHREAFRELARIARRELRITGMHTWTQPPRPHPYCHPVTQVLEGLGFAVELVPIDYDDGCQGGDGHLNQALVARRIDDQEGHSPAATASGTR